MGVVVGAVAGVVVGAVVGAGARAPARTVKTLTRHKALVSAATPPARLTPAALCMAFADALVPPPGSSPKKKKGAHTSDSAPTILQLWGTATVGAWVRGWVGAVSLFHLVVAWSSSQCRAWLMHGRVGCTHRRLLREMRGPSSVQRPSPSPLTCRCTSGLGTFSRGWSRP